MLGKAFDITEKTLIKRGPEVGPEDFEPEINLVDDNNLFS